MLLFQCQPRKEDVFYPADKKRGTVRCSFTYLVNTLRTLEATPDAPGVIDQAKQQITKYMYKSLDKDFRPIHHEIIDLFNEDSDELEKEQQALCKYEDDVTATSLCVQKIIVTSSLALTMVIREHYHVILPMCHLRAIEVALVSFKGA